MDTSLYSDKFVRKLRENNFIIGEVITNPEEFEAKKNVYDNLVVDNILENIK